MYKANITRLGRCGLVGSLVGMLALPTTVAAQAAAGEGHASSGYRWLVRNEMQPAPVTGGVFRAERRARLEIETPLAEDMRLVIAARFSRNGGVRLYTGRRDERLAIGFSAGEAPTLQCSYHAPTGERPMLRTLRLGELTQPNFGWTDTLLDWQAH